VIYQRQQADFNGRIFSLKSTKHLLNGNRRFLYRQVKIFHRSFYTYFLVLHVYLGTHVNLVVSFFNAPEARQYKKQGDEQQHLPGHAEDGRLYRTSKAYL